MTLSQQPRMDRVISDLVGDTFYKTTGGLLAIRARGAEPLVEPYSFHGKRIVWIDTGTTSRCEGFWSNEFEADLVTRVVRAMRPELGRRGGPSLTVGINHYANKPNAPFGGVKSSGLGRELGPEGITGYQVFKSIGRST